jgi:acyl-homoserine-lactone acylase
MTNRSRLGLLLLLTLTGCGNGGAVDRLDPAPDASAPRAPAAPAASAGSAAAGGPVAPAKAIADPAFDAEIRWTSFGIPHVKAPDRASLGYGVAFATARDAFCLIAAELVTVSGQRSRYFGDSEQNLASDLYYKAILSNARIAAAEDARAPEAASYARGYAAGYNRFLRDNADNLPSACAAAPWLRSMTDDDVTRLDMSLTLRHGLGHFRGAIAAAAPPPGRGWSRAAVDDLDHPEEADHAADLGSNAVAFGGAVTESGHGLLLGNPHYPWEGPSRFHMIHATIPGELDVMGASLVSASRITIGFNQHVAWTQTVSAATRATVYELSLHPRNPTRYRYGKGYRDMTVTTVDIERIGDDGSVVTEEHPVYHTHHGPVVSSAQLPWTRATAYAVRDVNLHNDRTAATYDALHRAASVADVEAALALQGIPWANTVAADRHGTAFYADMGAAPNIDAVLFHTCRVYPESASERVVVLNGSDPECEWRQDERSTIPGAMPVEDMPRLKRDDYVINANNSHWMTNPDDPLEGYSPIFGPERTPLSLRARAGFAFVRELLETGGGVRTDDARDLLYSHRNYAAELLLDDVLMLCNDAPPKVDLDGLPVDVIPVCATLAAWDRRMTTASRGGHVWREFWREARKIEYLYFVPFVVGNPLDTPRGLALAEEGTRQALLRALALARVRLESHDIDLDAELGQIQYVERDGERVPIPGGEGWAGMWSISRTRMTPDAGYTPVVSGNSYIQVVSWDDEGDLEAYGMLTYSQSPDPTSPHHGDLTRLYARGGWVTLPFHEHQILADPNLETLRLQE